jgi:ribose transport system substrate-binding protein
MNTQKSFWRVFVFVIATILMLSACSPATPTMQLTVVAPAEATEVVQPAATQPPASAKTYNFLLMGALVHPYYGPMPQGIADAAAKYGISPVPEFTMPQKFDMTEQNSIIDSYVAKGINGLAFQPDDPVAANQKITDLNKLGINVFSIAGCPVQPSPSLACLTTDTEELAYQGAKHLIEAIGGKGNIVHFTGQPEDTNTQNSLDGVNRAVKEFPDVKVLQHVTGMDSGPADAQNGVSSVLAASRADIDGIISTSGIATDVIANEFTKDKETRIKYIGLNNFPVILQAIKDGFATGTMSQNPYGQAYLATYSLKLLVDGCQWKPVSGDDWYINTGLLYITKDNVDTQAEELAQVTANLEKTWKEDHFTNCP